MELLWDSTGAASGSCSLGAAPSALAAGRSIRLRAAPREATGRGARPWQLPPAFRPLGRSRVCIISAASPLFFSLLLEFPQATRESAGAAATRPSELGTFRWILARLLAALRHASQLLRPARRLLGSPFLGCSPGSSRVGRLGGLVGDPLRSPVPSAREFRAKAGWPAIVLAQGLAS